MFTMNAESNFVTRQELNFTERITELERDF